MVSLIWIKWTQVKRSVDWLIRTRSYENWWGRWWTDGESQTIKSNLVLPASGCQQERRYLSSTLLILPGQMQPRCSPVRRTRHAYTFGAGERAEPPAPWVCRWSMGVWGQTANDHQRCPLKWPQGLAVFSPHQDCVLPNSPKNTHLCWWEQHNRFKSCASPGGQHFWRWDSVSPRHTDWATHHEQQQLCFGQEYSSAWNNGAVMGPLPLRNRTILTSRHSYSSVINYILLEINPRLFLRACFFPTRILYW